MSYSLQPDQLIASHPQANFNYWIEEVLEAGLVLMGTEVQSMRHHTPQLRDAYVEIRSGNLSYKKEAWLLNLHIPPYSHGNRWNHEPLRARKLLMNRRQLNQWSVAVAQQGFTIVPLKLYFKKGKVKIAIGLGRGKKKFDKRETLKLKTAAREIQQAFKKKQFD